ncbi:MAG: hypothetical protein PHW10_05490 [Candidatus Peribacteraceae bacterium]|nr:hypothetical protein [Candidatus Peribacteraceae bacterium]
MKAPKLFGAAWFLLLLTAADALAQEGHSITIPGPPLASVLSSIVNSMATVIAGLAITVFLVGAFWKVLFAGKEDEAKKGNSMMAGALKGFIIVGMSYAIIRVVFFVIY